jgi:putative ABC transport system permease protein
MRRVTLRSLWAHKRRLLSTAIAIVLGVGFMSGTFILSTTLDQVADDLFKDSASSIDALVQGDLLSDASVGGRQRADLPPRAVAAARRVEGVAAAGPRVSTKGAGSTNRILDPFGRPLGSQAGPATIFENWIADPTLTPYRIDDGRAPQADDEIVLNVAAAEDAGVGLGQSLVVVGQFGPQPYRVVGTFTTGVAKSSGGAVSVEFTLAEVQRLAGTHGRIDSVYVKGVDGLSQEEVVTRLDADLRGVEVITGEQAVAELSQGGTSDIRFLQMVLVVFGVVALLVGAFVISNTFTILVAQRTRELALLRALGASRVQVFGSVVLEAAAVGVVSSVVGLGVGLYLATWINRGLAGIGAELPTGSLVVRPATLVLSLVTGVAVTLLAALGPAFRATRVRPLAALREIAVDRAGASRRRVLCGLAVLVAGAVGCSAAWRRQGAAGAIPTVGLGAVLVIVGVIVVGPLLAGRTVGLPGPLLFWFKGITGRLATENAARSPRRTSATASAVLISVALVVFVSAFAASAAQSVESDARRGFAGDFVVTGPGGLTLPNGLLSSPIPPTVVDAVRQVRGVRLVAGMGFGSATVTYPDGASGTHFVSSVDRAGLGTVLRPRMTEGDATDLDDHGILADRVMAREHHLRLGDEIVYVVSGGRPITLEVQGISDDPNLLGYFTVTRATYASVAPEIRDVQVAGLFEPGADAPRVLNRIRRAIIGTPDVWAYDREAFIGNLNDQISAFINVIYGLLVLSVLISVLGIANTLSLTIHERTRELGLLRAVGMDRSGVRSSVRMEALLIAAFGMAVGLVVGVGVSLAVVRSLREFGLVTFTVPTPSLVLIAVGAVVFGGLASIRPAQRAAHASILDAIATD